MDKLIDTFAWTHKVECPPAICTDSVKKILHTGLVGLLWDELANVIFNAEEAKIIRKNILLYQLKHGTHNKVIQCTRDISELKLSRNNLRNQITELEEEYEQQDFVVRQKVKKLQDISSKYAKVRARRNLYKMKHEQINTQLHDCNNMRLVCQNLMPGTCKDLDPKILVEAFDMVTNLWSGANKRQVWDTVSNILGNIEVSTLWQHLYQTLTKNVDTLFKSTSMKSMNADQESINVRFARVHGQHVSMVSKQLLYNAKAKNHQQNVLGVIEKIEVVSNNSVDICEWLALALEVSKLECEQRTLQKEIDKIQDSLYENNTVTNELAEIISEIQNISTERTECVQEIQQSLSLLKSAPTLLAKVEEKINLELEKIAAMRKSGYDSLKLNDDLTSELDIFHEGLNLDALRKVLLKGDIGVYRHIRSCFSEGSISITNSQTSNVISYFPTIQIPIYSLINCYKNLISTTIYKRFECSEIEDSQLPLSVFTREKNYNTIELLKLSKIVNTKTRTEIKEFDEIFNAWVNQTVQKAMEIVDKMVDDATFSEWLERYTLSLYMLQNAT